MPNLIIPIRPENEYPLTEQEMDALTWFTIKGCTKETAYRLFMQVPQDMPEMAVKRSAAELFACKEARMYVEDYKKVLTKATTPPPPPPPTTFVMPQPRPTDTPPTKTNEEKQREEKERKIRAVERLRDFVIKRMAQIDREENPDEVIKFADKLGLLDNTETGMEQPRRYLPVSCGNCEYKRFIEKNCYNGET